MLVTALPPTPPAPFYGPARTARQAPSPGGAETPSPLSAEHIGQLQDATRRMAKIRRGVGVARFSGWTMGIIGGTSLVFSTIGLLWIISGDFSSVPGLLIGAAIVACAVNELRGGRALHRLDPRAPRRLAFNQLWVTLAIGGYCVWNVIAAFNTPSSLQGMAASGDPGIDGLVNDLRGMEIYLRTGFYGVVLLIVSLVSGMTALFYLKRRAHIVAYCEQTPAWIVDLQTRGVL